MQNEKGKNVSPHFGKKEISKRPNGTVRVRTINSLPSRVQEHQSVMTNPNDIVRKYGYNNLPMPQGGYADFSQMGDLMEARKTILQAEQSFMKLPSEVRSKFKNDPNELIKFLQSDAEHDIAESIKLGLRQKPEAPQADPLLETMTRIEENTRKKPAPKKADG